MNYAGMIKNDISAGEGVCVTVFTQGCPNHCVDCHNPETWDFDGGKEFTADTLREIISAISANDIQRNFCVMGGEPLCQENLFLTQLMCQTVRKEYPDIKIYIWTGYNYDDLVAKAQGGDTKLTNIFALSDYVIDGPYIAAERDITLPMRGSRNQRIIELRADK